MQPRALINFSFRLCRNMSMQLHRGALGGCDLWIDLACKRCGKPECNLLNYCFECYNLPAQRCQSCHMPIPVPNCPPDCRRLCLPCYNNDPMKWPQSKCRRCHQHSVLTREGMPLCRLCLEKEKFASIYTTTSLFIKYCQV